jgi:hypothetical protein
MEEREIYRCVAPRAVDTSIVMPCTLEDTLQGEIRAKQVRVDMNLERKSGVQSKFCQGPSMRNDRYVNSVTARAQHQEKALYFAFVLDQRKMAWATRGISCWEEKEFTRPGSSLGVDLA